MIKKIAVVAFGGNALLRDNEIGTIKQQEKHAYDTLTHLLKLLEDDFSIVITHGNGPQVGNIMLRNDAGYNEFKIPKMPLDICVADSQGGIGYMIERQMKNILNENKIKKRKRFISFCRHSWLCSLDNYYVQIWLYQLLKILLCTNSISKSPTKHNLGLGTRYLQSETMLLQFLYILHILPTY